VSASIESQTVRHAHNGAADTRTTIAIGESVSLSLDCNTFSDPDLYRANPCAAWTTLYDTLGSAAFRKGSGSFGSVRSDGINRDGILIGRLDVSYYGTGGSAVVEAVIEDTPLYYDDTPLIKSKTFTFVTPGYTFAYANKKCGNSTGSNYIGGWYYRAYDLTPRGVNWENLYVQENVPAVSFEWPNCTLDEFPGYILGGSIGTEGRFGDNHKTGSRPRYYLVVTMFSVSQPGVVEYRMNSGFFMPFGATWIHVDAFNGYNGVDTMQGNGHSGDAGPWLTDHDF
jgi:hypothetical protein